VDFIIGFSNTSRRHDFIMVVVDKLTKVAHFIPMKSTNSSSEVVQVFIGEIVRLYHVPMKVVSNRDAKFTSRF